MSFCCAKTNCEEDEPSESQAENIGGERKFVIPRSWIHQDDGSGRITLEVKLRGCTKDDVKVKIWNQHQLLVLAACKFHQYELQYRIPRGARLLSTPTFASKTEMLTCRFSGFYPVCVNCHTPIPHRSILPKDMFASALKRPKLELIQPRHSITYDGKMALFEAHLEGCKNYSQINFHVANDKVMLLANLSAQHNYYLSFRLESSAEFDWEVHFHPEMQILTCTIPLLGHYECGKCMAKRHLKAEKVVREQTEEASSSGNPSGTNGQETKRSGRKKTATFGRDHVKLSLDVLHVADAKNSTMKSFLYSETNI